jgi:hypothetical protein
LLAIVVVGVALLTMGTWARYRVAAGPGRQWTARVRYQFIDLGQGDPLRGYVEHLLGNERLWLDSADPPWIYVSREVRRECWAGIRPDTTTHTKEVAFTVRELAFGGGYTPATNIRVTQVEGRPLITK